jgi:RNA polymerase sigma factor (sigma-70 family)
MNVLCSSTPDDDDARIPEHDQSNIGDSTLFELMGVSINRDRHNDAVKRFERRYMERLLILIDRNFSKEYRRGQKVEEVAQNVMASMIVRLRSKKMRPKSGREVWRLLCAVALNKVRNNVRDALTRKNNVHLEVRGVDFDLEVSDPGEQDAIEFKDLLETLQRELGPEVSKNLMMRLEGFSVEEISAELNISTRSVHRQLVEKIRPAILRHLPEECWKRFLKLEDD